MLSSVCKFVRRIATTYLVASLCFAGLYGAHIHLSETHADFEEHRHDAEFHVAHGNAHHDDIASGSHHLTDASFVELDRTVNLVPGDDDVAPVFFALILFLLVAPITLPTRGRQRDCVVRINMPPGAHPGARGPP